LLAICGLSDLRTPPRAFPTWKRIPTI
jgi:hypothetical protein